jgi:hypothetical protein
LRFEPKLEKLTINLKSGKEAEDTNWIELGNYECGNDTAITISSVGVGVDGYVVVDAVCLLAE